MDGDELMNAAVPFIFKFKTKNNLYVYDINSNRIFRVDDVTYHIFDFFGKLSKNEIVKKLSTQYESKIITERYDDIEKNQKENGIFLSFHPQQIQIATKQEIISQLESSLSQLILNVTEVCNLRCKYCVFSGLYPLERVHSSRKMTTDIAKKAIDFYLTHNQKTEESVISFYGGEPLTNFEVIQESVNYAKQKFPLKKFFFHIITNGTLLHNTITEYLMANNFQITVSLDGPEEIHDRFRVFENGKGTYKTIIDNLKKIREMNPEYYKKNIRFEITLSPDIDPKFIYNFFSECDLTKGHFMNLQMISKNDTTFHTTYLSDTILNFQDSWEELRMKFLQLNNGEQKEIDFFLHGIFKNPYESLTIHRALECMKPEVIFHICIPGQTRLFVSVDGKFYMCEKMGEHMELGSVHENGFNYEKIIKIIDDFCTISTPDCVECWAVRLCGICYVMARQGDHFDINRKRIMCSDYKDILHKALVDYTTLLEKYPKAFNLFRTNRDRLVDE